MRVLLISHTCQSKTEGQPKAVELAALPGITLRVLTPDRWKHYGAWRQPDRTRDFDLKVGKVLWPWAGPGQFYMHWYPALGRILREFRPDIIDLWEEPWSMVSAHTCWLRDRVLPSAKIVSETEQNIFKNLPPPFEQFRAYTIRRADYVIGRNVESIEHLQRKGYAGPSRVVPNAVDAELFQPLSAAQRSETRAKQGVGNAFLLGYIGRLVPEKGILDILEALAQLPPEVHLALVGEGPQRAELEARVRELGVENRTHFWGVRPLEELPPLMGSLDALVLPSHTTPSWKEQFGRVLIEAMACEVPVIGSDSGAIPEVIGSGDEATGLVFPEGDAAALAQAILQLRADPEAARALGRVGRRSVEARYTWRRVAEAMRDVYQDVL